MINNKITIAIENPETQVKFASYGAGLAKRLNKKITLTSIAKVPVITPQAVTTLSDNSNFDSYHIEDVKNFLEINMNKLCLHCKKTWQHIDYDVEIGFLETSLIKKADQDMPFLFLVEGNNELTTISEWFGTYETRLAEQIIAPTLVVPSNYSWKPVHDILYVMKMDDSKVKNLRVLSNIAKELNANLQVIIVAEDEGPDSFREYLRIVSALETFFDYKYLKHQYAASLNSIKEIRRRADSLKVSWLAFEHEESSFIDRIFSDFSSKRLILDAEIPVLVF